jgi:hypothetical protein
MRRANGEFCHGKFVRSDLAMGEECLLVEREVQAFSEDELPRLALDRNGILSPDIAFLCAGHRSS